MVKRNVPESTIFAVFQHVSAIFRLYPAWPPLGPFKARDCHWLCQQLEETGFLRGDGHQSLVKKVCINIYIYPRDPSTFSEGTWTLQTSKTVSNTSPYLRFGRKTDPFQRVYAALGSYGRTRGFETGRSLADSLGP